MTILQWHAQPVVLALRLLPLGQLGPKYSAVAQGMLLAHGWAYVHSLLRTDGQDLDRHDFAALVHKLRLDYGVDTIVMARHNRMEGRYFPDTGPSLGRRFYLDKPGERPHVARTSSPKPLIDNRSSPPVLGTI